MTLRRTLVSKPLMKAVKPLLPTISDTERVALEAGTVGWDRDLLGGRPHWRKLRDMQVKKLTAAEKAFLEGPVEELCAMVTDWDFNQQRDLPKKVWDFLKKKKFFGMVIAKKDGGLGFSAAAHAAVVTRLATRSTALAVIVMVPNSLGPGELLHRYGTPAQKKHYLPRLADGRDIPCFALTEPHAGSDAASGQSVGTIGYGVWKGKKTLGIKLTFNKRYITLAPVATVIGLAFRLRDPGNFLGKGEDVGITCALLPRTLKGLNIGRRHDPMGIPFPNGPLWGKDVFIPLDFIIGGKAMAGQGWRMLMEALAAGRGISLPSLSVGAAQLVTASTAAYAVSRQQFGMSIGGFEGIRERLARIAGLTYALTATRWLTAGFIDAGENPAVLSGIAKEKLTETMRLLVDDGMDIFAGAAISRGPRNILGRGYTSVPIAITVEGANILTRSLIIFGQGALRSHPYLQAEVDALTRGDARAFDTAFFGHIGHALRSLARAKCYTLTGARFVSTGLPAPLHRQAQKLSHLSTQLAVLTELALLTLGGNLKRKEYLSGRYADAFSWLYIASASLKYAHAGGLTAADMLANKWVQAHARHEAEKAMLAILDNLRDEGAAARTLATLVKLALFPLGPRFKPPRDKLGDALAAALLEAKSDLADLLTGLVYKPAASEAGLGALLHATGLWHAAAPAMAKIRQAVRAKKIKKAPLPAMADAALKTGVITRAEHKALLAAETARDDVVQVDHFDPATYKTLR